MFKGVSKISNSNLLKTLINAFFLGKMNRGLSVVDTLKILQNDQLTAEELFKSRVLGWCVEWVSKYRNHISFDFIN
jgi:hypothetical protein